MSIYNMLQKNVEADIRVFDVLGKLLTYTPLSDQNKPSWGFSPRD